MNNQEDLPIFTTTGELMINNPESRNNTTNHPVVMERYKTTIDEDLYKSKNQSKRTTLNIKDEQRTHHDTLIIPTSFGRRENINFLVDSGATVSIIKERFASNLGDIDKDSRILLKGIGLGETETIGIVKSSMNWNSQKRTTQYFHVVNDTFQITEDGILGKDFLKNHKAQVNHAKDTITIYGQRLNVNQDCKKIILPPYQCTTVIIKTKNDTDYLCKSKIISKNVFVGNCLIRPKNNKARICVINTNQKSVEINKIKLELVPLEELNIYKIGTKTPTLEDKKRKCVPNSEKMEKIIENLDPDLNHEESVSIIELCNEFADLFYSEGEPLSCVKGIHHEIPLYSDAKPINKRQYRLPHALKEEVNRQVAEMEQQGIIEPSSSPFNSPLLVVAKKADSDGNKRWRVVVDFRAVNEHTISDAYPLPLISDIFDKLGNVEYYSSLDMAKGYHQIEMAPWDKHKTAFSTDYGHFQYKRMPFGLKNAQSTFQRMINQMLMSERGVGCLVYLDDIIIFGSNLQEHNENLRKVFEVLRNGNLKIQTEKCQFLKREIRYLGHIITNKGIKPNPKTTEAVCKFPQPKNARNVRGFIGLASYYRKHMEHFASIAEPLHQLTRKDKKFEWSEKCAEAFETIKARLAEPPILQYPDFSKQFIITTDASECGLGAVLSQLHNGDDLPISYASRVLKPAEKNYSTIEKEMLGVKWAVETFRPYVFGRQFLIVTDHKPLVGDLKKASRRILQWNLELAEYDYKVQHKSGKLNTNADALSRIKTPTINVITRAQAAQLHNDLPNEEEEVEEKEEVDQTGIKIEQATPTKIRIVTDPSDKQRILQEYHDSPIGGHCGVWRTYKRIQILYYWQNMLRDIRNYIKTCRKCKANKSARLTRTPLTITSTSRVPFERVALDIVGPLPLTEKGNKFLLTFQDDFTKFSGAIAVPDQEAETVAKAFCEGVITKHGIPEKILTDRGPNFLGKVLVGVCKLLKIKKLTTTAYRPQTNGALEKSHNTLKEYLRNFASPDDSNWDEMIHYANFVYNTTPHSSTRFTPYFLLYGHQAKIPTSLKKEVEPQYSYDDYASELRARLQLAHHVARSNIVKQKQQTKEQYDKKLNVFIPAVGSKVWLRNNARKNKQDSLWLGPYMVLESHPPTNTTIMRNGKSVKVHNDWLKKDD